MNELLGLCKNLFIFLIFKILSKGTKISSLIAFILILNPVHFVPWNKLQISQFLFFVCVDPHTSPDTYQYENENASQIPLPPPEKKSMVYYKFNISKNRNRIKSSESLAKSCNRSEMDAKK